MANTTGRDPGILGILEIPGQAIAKAIAKVPVLGQAEGAVTASVAGPQGRAGVRELRQETGANSPASQGASFITSVNDFLNWIAWIFHPLNLLRAVEFVTGLFLFYLGLKPYLDRSGRTGGTLRRVVMASPAGTRVRMAQGARMGRREGQRESARMQARQRETRSQREASARERVQINREARQ